MKPRALAWVGLMGVLVCPRLLAQAAVPPAEAPAPFCEGRPAAQRTGPDQSAAETFRLRLVNRIFGAISISRDQGRSWTRLGRVLRPDPGRAHAIGPMEFTASDWAPVGAVTATAVNALHLKVGQGEPHALVFSVLPAELAESGPTGSYRDAEASILTDVPAGTGIFGLQAAPRVGDGLYLEEMVSGRLTPWPPGRAPALGDRLVVVSRRSPHGGGALEIENLEGGAATWVDASGRRTVLGRTLRRVSGTGRFGGTAYQSSGKVRANHPGVLCLSTSPARGEAGGFQIVPCHHASDPVLRYVPATPAYLVLGEVEGRAALEGQAPLFGRAFRPGDVYELKIAGLWQPAPAVGGKVDDALAAVEAIRIRAAP